MLDSGVVYHNQLIEAYTGAYVTWEIYLGRKLGIYDLLLEKDDVGMFPSEIADSLALFPRAVLEWCRAQAAAEILEVVKPSEIKARAKDMDDDEAEALLAKAETEISFRLPVGARELLRGGGPAMDLFAAFSDMLPLVGYRADEVEWGFRSGYGWNYDAAGATGSRAGAAVLVPFYRNKFIPKVVEATPALLEKLEQDDCKVADIGCGHGDLLLTIAAKYGNTTCHGYDLSAIAIEMAKEKKETEAGAGTIDGDKVSFSEDSIPEEGEYDVIITANSFTEMERPDEMAESIKKALKPDGIWLIIDFDTANDAHGVGNFDKALAPVLYTMSLTISVPSGLGENGEGMALGMFGLTEDKARKMLVDDVGFSALEKLDIPHAVSAFYIVRP